MLWVLFCIQTPTTIGRSCSHRHKMFRSGCEKNSKLCSCTPCEHSPQVACTMNLLHLCCGYASQESVVLKVTKRKRWARCQIWSGLRFCVRNQWPPWRPEDLVAHTRQLDALIYPHSSSCTGSTPHYSIGWFTIVRTELYSFGTSYQSWYIVQAFLYVRISLLNGD